MDQQPGQWIAYVLTAGIAALLLVVEHYLPWRGLLGRDLPRLWAYVLGVLALILPLSGLLAFWAEWGALGALWLVTGAGGLAVIFCYLFDAWLWAREEARMAVRERNTLIGMVDDGTDKNRYRERSGGAGRRAGGLGERAGNFGDDPGED